MSSHLQALERRIAKATGQDRDLDRAIAETIDPDAPGRYGARLHIVGGYLPGADRTVLPDWHWHVGHGPSGILPYASLSKTSGPDDEMPLRVEASAATVPVALLHADGQSPDR